MSFEVWNMKLASENRCKIIHPHLYISHFNINSSNILVPCVFLHRPESACFILSYKQISHSVYTAFPTARQNSLPPTRSSECTCFVFNLRGRISIWMPNPFKYIENKTMYGITQFSSCFAHSTFEVLVFSRIGMVSMIRKENSIFHILFFHYICKS